MSTPGQLRLAGALFCSWYGLLAPDQASALTVQVVTSQTNHVVVGDTWRFWRGRVAPSAPADAWKEIGFNDSAWEQGPSGFGFGDDDDATLLLDMAGNYFTVYIRKEIELPAVPAAAPLELVIDYDDGFVAYLNGQEVARRFLPAGPVNFQTPANIHEAGTPETIVLGNAAELLHAGVNVLAIEGHNTSLSSGDFSLIPALRTGGDAVQEGTTWIVGRSNITLAGVTTAASATAVRINGAPAAFNSGTRAWQADVVLVPGVNSYLVEAIDAASAVVDSADFEVVLVVDSSRVTGTLAQDTVWSGALIVEGTLTVPAGRRLTIEPGTWVFLDAAASIVVRGRLLADGTGSSPIHFTRRPGSSTWRQLRFIKAEEARLRHCVIEYADSEGDHRDYYNAGPRNYREAVLALACHLDVEDCIFRHLPDAGAAAEGDAIAVIADDPAESGKATANIRRSSFVDIGQGVHSRFAYVLVEESFFSGKRGDNDDVDLWGESEPPPLILNNVFLNPEHDDTINPTRCSAVIVGNLIAGTDDHGLVLRDAGSPIVMNNVIYDCANGGIAIENSCDALLVNNTIVDCGRGLRLFDLGRWDAPYFLSPGGGSATVINCIIWDCPQPITLEDSDNTTIADRGSHVTLIHCNIQGGQAGVRVNGAQSTVTWGAGNINVDPQFVDAAARDYRLLPGSPAVNAGTGEQAPTSDITGAMRPCDGATDMGAYELCADAPPVFRRGDANTDGSADISDAVFVLLYLFAGGATPTCLEAADSDDNGAAQLGDAIYLLNFLFRGGATPGAPFPNCGADVDGPGLGCVAYPMCQ